MAKHRKQTRTQRLAVRAAIGVLPMTAIVTGGTIAQAAPTPQFIAPQPGVTTPPNPGATVPAPDAPTRQPGVTTEPPPMTYVAPEDDARGVAPETDYLPTRQVPQRDYVAPLRPETLHAPEPTPPVAEIVPPDRTLRAGDLTMDAPEFLTLDQINQANAATAGPEADISQFARSVGVAPSRADMVAASAVAGAVQGAVIGCAIGSTLQIVTVIAFPLTPLTCLTWGATGLVAGTLIGAGMGGLK
ncbi:hypothetical protein HLB23_35455 [Nocardia uniformis]|uniref:Secreted protein n=1 Tax=Nocardia uniformis TaxID=53432 RepID=A0A849CGW5_9NOCA|nr:hypothetical protein [Nocardia uniformis]NNH75089.1 hypothetical protein [Nocardia uniformis]